MCVESERDMENERRMQTGKKAKKRKRNRKRSQTNVQRKGKQDTVKQPTNQTNIHIHTHEATKR
jgi:hypothetical protein